jgi:hypothetical protein
MGADHHEIGERRLVDEEVGRGCVRERPADLQVGVFGRPGLEGMHDLIALLLLPQLGQLGPTAMGYPISSWGWGSCQE